jgi:DNA-directed RNA polymerase subunit RPC12/RpoP
MALNVVQPSDACRSLTTGEILEIETRCMSGHIYRQYKQEADGSIKKARECPDCRTAILVKARAAQPLGRKYNKGPGTAAKITAMRGQLEQAKRQAEAAAENYPGPVKPNVERSELVVEIPAPTVSEKRAGTVTLDFSQYPRLIEELGFLAIEDVRTIEEEAIWILQDYANMVRAMTRTIVTQRREP